MTEKDDARAETKEEKAAAKEDDAIRAEAKKQDDAARKKNEEAEHDAKVREARTVFSDDEDVPGGASRRLAHPGEVTDQFGNPDPYGDHVNVGTAFNPDIREIAGLAPDHARKLGLPTGVSGVAENPNLPEPDAPAAPDDERDAPVAKKPATK